MTNCLLKGKENDDAETRKQACKSLIVSVMVLGVKNLQPETRSKILETLSTQAEMGSTSASI